MSDAENREIPPRPLPKPPSHPRKLPLLKRARSLAHSSIHALYDKSFDMKMGDIKAPTRDFFFLTDVPEVNRVLAAPTEKYPKSSLMVAILRQLLGNSIVVTNGALWRRQRRMLDPAYSHTSIKATFAPMVDAARDLVGRLAPKADGTSIAIDLEMTHVTADVIFRTIYSRPMRRDEAEEIFTTFERYQDLSWRHSVWMMAGVPERLSLPRLRSRGPARRIRALLASGVEERLALIERGETPPSDILQSMIEARDPETGERFDREGLIDQVGITFLAGHETSASALAWTLFLLARHREHRDRVEAEAQVFWNDGSPEARDLRKLRHTRDCFREAMRLYPPIAFVPRDVPEEETIRGKRVKRGSILMLSPYLIHRQRRIWTKPDEFDPDRFSRQEEKGAIRDAYMPFIKGPRVCLGASFAMQEGVIVLAAMLANFRLHEDETHEPEPYSRLTLRSANGIRVRLESR